MLTTEEVSQYIRLTLKQHKVEVKVEFSDYVWKKRRACGMYFSKEKTIHPCQIPEEVIRRIILTTAKENELIIDPFAGSGTTLKVAKNLGFNYLGFEIDKQYIEKAKDISTNIHKLGLATTHEPPSVAAGCILLIENMYHIDISKKNNFYNI